jgi:hypothetical protein
VLWIWIFGKATYKKVKRKKDQCCKELDVSLLEGWRLLQELGVIDGCLGGVYVLLRKNWLRPKSRLEKNSIYVTLNLRPALVSSSLLSLGKRELKKTSLHSS